MLTLRYIYQDTKVERDFSLSEIDGIEDETHIDKWDLLNLVATEASNNPTDLYPDMAATPRGGERNNIDDGRIIDIARGFGFSCIIIFYTSSHDPVINIL